MVDDHDTGDETAPPPAGPKRYYAVQEFYGGDTCGLSHHVVARDLMHALEVLSCVDFSDAVRLEIIEMDRQQAQLLRVRDDRADRPGSYPFADAEVGDHFCEEY